MLLTDLEKCKSGKIGSSPIMEPLNGGILDETYAEKSQK